MTHVKVQLFGRIQVINNDQPIDLKSRKALALIAYLALTQQPHSRDRLAALLWPESDEKRAHNSLSRSLYQLNQTPLAEWLETEGDAVALETQAVVVDVNRFDQLLKQWRTHNHPPAQLCSDCLADLSEAVGLYQDDFLADFYLADANDFESWAAAQRQRLRRQMLRVLEALAQTYAARAEFDRTRRYARRQLELDDLQEPAIRLLLESLARTGRRREALAEFECYKARMWEELGLEVSAETQTLIEAIRSGDLDPAPVGPQTPSATKPITTGRQKPVDRRQLRILLDKVKSFWVEGVLENSLHGAALLELGLELRPGEVDYPWGLVIQRPGEERYVLPGGLSMADVFDDNGQALLILGQPGSGKTTMMLDLAQTLIRRAEADDSHLIPAVFNLSSWQSGPLINWLETELNEKYLIPKKIGRQWLAGDHLLPLLDGLDEVNIDRRDDCVQAINAYRQAHGLVPLVVCSRVAEYEELALKLKLENAVLLQPLSDAQIDNYLVAAGDRLDALRQKLAVDAEMQDMARTPLMLSIMSLTYQDSAEVAVKADMGSGQRERQLFDNYIDQMYERRGSDQRYGRAQTDHWLSWLAVSMERQGESIFLIEQLQPTWLRWSWLQVAYFFLSRFVVLISLSFLISWTSLYLGDLEFLGYIRWLTFLGLLGQYLTFCAIFAALLASVAFLRSRTPGLDPPPVKSRGRHLLRQLVAILIVAVCGAVSFLLTDQLLPFFQPSPLDRNYEFVRAIVFTAFIIGLGSVNRTTLQDIRPIETLRWSGRRALLGALGLGLFGAAAGVLLALLFNQPLGSWVAATMMNGFIPGLYIFGYQVGVLALQASPNQGIKLSLRFGLRMGLLIGCTTALLYLAFLLWLPEFVVGWNNIAWAMITFGILGFLWFGGLEVTYHTCLRLILWQQGRLPLRLGPFLDQAVSLLFLRRAGGAYLFAHDRLRSYFAAAGNEPERRPYKSQTEAQSGLRTRRLIPIASLLILIALWFTGLRFAYESFEISTPPDDPLAGRSLPKANGEVSCQQASSLPRDNVIYLTFQNKIDRDLAIYFVNDAGEEIYYNIVRAGRRWMIGTYETRSYCIRDVETGLPVFAYVVTADSPQIVVIPPAPE